MRESLVELVSSIAKASDWEGEKGRFEGGAHSHSPTFSTYSTRTRPSTCIPTDHTYSLPQVIVQTLQTSSRRFNRFSSFIKHRPRYPEHGPTQGQRVSVGSQDC